MEFQQRGAKVEEELGGKRQATTEEWTSNIKQPLRSLRNDSISTQQSQRSSRVIVAAASGVGSVDNWESATCSEERTLSYGCQRGDRGVVVFLVVVVPVNSR